MKFTVLPVDDHAVVRQVLVNILTMTDDFTLVGEASDGARAIELARELVPDLIGLDLLMPGMEGDALLDTLRRVVAGDAVIHPDIAHRILRGVRTCG